MSRAKSPAALRPNGSVGSGNIARHLRAGMDEPMCSEQMQNAMRELQDTMVVMAHIEKAQSEHLGDLVQFRIRTEQNLAEFTDTLNGLMGPKT